MSNTGFLIAAVVIALLFGLSFAVKALLWVAIIAAAVWLAGIMLNGARRAA